MFLVRHARPEVAAGVCYGRTDLGVLTQEQAAVLARIRPLLPVGAPVYSSPLQRCRGLALPLATALQSAEVIFDARLAEMDFGTWEMRAWDDIPRAEVDAWAADLLHARPGGGECVLEVAQRVREFYEQLLAAGHCAAVVVAHAGTMRLLSRCTEATTLPEMALAAARSPHTIDYGAVLALDC